MKKSLTACFTLLCLFFSTQNLNAQCPTINVNFANADCAGTGLGTISISIADGIAPYDVELFIGSTLVETYNVTEPSVLNIDALDVGTYSIVVTDSDLCEVTEEVTIVAPEPLEVTVSSTTFVTCAGACDGVVDIVVTGGVPPYTYQWSDGSITPFPQNLCAGTYSVTIVDANGCIAETLAVVMEGTPLQITVDDVTDSVCYDEQGGAINISVINGTTPLSFNWSGPNGFNATTEDLTFLYPGIYTLIVVDANGCMLTQTFEVLSPGEIIVEFNVTAESCVDDGLIEIVSINGGTAPYTHSLDGGPFTSETIYSNLVAGVYSIVTLDANGCEVENFLTIESDIQLAATSTVAGCGTNDGTATVEVLSNQTNVTYLWSNAATTETVTGLAVGGYSVTVTDNDSGCSTHINVEVELDPACFVTISGYAYNDNENEACIADASVLPGSNVMVELSNGDLTFTDANGYYEFITVPGTYTIDLILNTGLFEPLCADPITVTLDNFGDIAAENNFFLTYNGFNNLCISAYYTNARPGFDQTVTIYAYNYGSETMNGTVTFQHDPIQEPVYVEPLATNYDEPNSTYTWDFENLIPLTQNTYHLGLYLNEDVELGTPINQLYTIDPIMGDSVPENNTKVVEMVVTGSFDPNDKAVIPKGEGPEGFIYRADSVLNYLIRFQNTGTDTAFTVVIRDTLDTDLNVRSLIPGASSHDYTLNIIEDNIIEFRFENIMLPDSFVNEPASNGHVLFDIHTKTGLPYGTTFENRAAIYFDFNEPVITNTVVNTLTMPVGIIPIVDNTIELAAQPNPTSNMVYLDYELAETSDLNIKLYDINGQLVTQTLQRSINASGDA